MNRSDISWGWDALYLSAGIIAFIAIFVVVSCCRLSGRISRDEEARELRNTLPNINRAA